MQEPNRWSSKEAASWAGIPHRTLLDLFNARLLPAIPVGGPGTQILKNGTTRRRRVGKWIVPREAFIRAWQTFSVQPIETERRRAG
jgi:hypothetical protein